MKAEALTLGEWPLLLFADNLIFVLPPLALLALCRFLSERHRGLLDRLRARLRHSRETLRWIVGIIGFLLRADSLAHVECLGLLGGIGD